jgi:cytochrome c oxidase cbb3-type subunit 4
VDPGDLFGLWTLLVLIVFLAIVVWAFSKKRRKRFEEAARIPLEEDKPTTRSRQEKK